MADGTTVTPTCGASPLWESPVSRSGRLGLPSPAEPRPGIHCPTRAPARGHTDATGPRVGGLVGARKCSALFASGLQPSDAPTAETVARTIRRATGRRGVCGCVAWMAQEFGDHPDAVAARMRWARQLTACLRPACPAAMTQPPKGRQNEQTCDRCGPAVRVDQGRLSCRASKRTGSRVGMPVSGSPATWAATAGD